MPKVEIERVIRATPETVFAYFTDSERYTAWMGVEAELDATPGGVYRVKVPQGTYAVGEFVDVEPPHRIVFTWGWEGDTELPPGSSRVEITLTATREGTIVRLLHSGLPHAGAAELHTFGWERYATRLVVVAEGGDPGPDRA